MTDIKAVPVDYDGNVILAPAVPLDRLAVWDGRIFTSFDEITNYSPGVWEKIDKVLMGMDDYPQPVNLTPGALGVRCEE